MLESTLAMNVYFTNLGCKLNQAEVEHLAREFRAAGYRVVGRLDEAELHVINSCTVTQAAARDSRKVARRGGRRHPGLKTVLTGCYASVSMVEAEALADVDLVVDNSRKDALVEIVGERFQECRPPRVGAVGDGGVVPVSYVPLEFSHARAAVKIEDGCNMRCSFCIIPFTRGKQRSRDAEEVLAEVRGLAEGGALEIVVTGVQISSYRSSSGTDDHRLYDLVRCLLDRTEVPRLRLTSIAPWQFDPRLLDLWPNDRMCRHFHLSLQSGCDDTLKRMRRPYTTESYADLIATIRERIPDVAITTDVIVGFPGETETEFEHSLDFVERQRFARVHVFGYSSRNGTTAANMVEHVDAPTKKSRVARMLAVAGTGQRAFLEEQIGNTVTVLWEGRRDGSWRGMTDNYIRVFSGAEDVLHGTMTLAHLTKAVDEGAWGELRLEKGRRS